MCPKSYLYIYDFSAYLHLCPSNRSEPIGVGSKLSQFSASCIRFHPEGHVSEHFILNDFTNLSSIITYCIALPESSKRSLPPHLLNHFLMFTTQPDDRILLLWFFCSLHPTFQARCGNRWFGIFLSFVMYLYTLWSANSSMGRTPVSKSITW